MPSYPPAGVRNNPISRNLRQVRGVADEATIRETPNVNLRNSSGAPLYHGDIVVLDFSTEYGVKLAELSDTVRIPLVVKVNTPVGDVVKCYAPNYNVVRIACDSAQVSPGDPIVASDAPRLGTATVGETFSYTVGHALTEKAAGYVGYVYVLLSTGLSFAPDAPITTSATFIFNRGYTEWRDTLGNVVGSIDTSGAEPDGCSRFLCLTSGRLTLSTEPMSEDNDPVRPADILITHEGNERLVTLTVRGDPETEYESFYEEMRKAPVLRHVLEHSDGSTLTLEMMLDPESISDEVYLRVVYDEGLLYTATEWLKLSRDTLRLGDGILLETQGGQSVRTVTVDASYEATRGDHIILCNAVGGPITVDLPVAAAVEGLVLHVKKIDASANVVIVDGFGTETIDGVATKPLSAQYDHIAFVSDGSSWWVI